MRRNVERADRVDLIAEKVDAVRHVGRKRKNVDDSAAYRVLSRFVNEIDPFETVRREDFFDECRRETVASAQRQDAFAELLLADDFFGQRFRIGAERQRAAVVVFYGVQRCRSLYDPRRIFLSELDRTFVAGREKQQSFFAQQRKQIVVQVARRVPVFHDEDVQPSGLPHGCCRDQRQRRSGQRSQSDAAAGTDLRGQLPVSFFAGKKLQQFVGGHGAVQNNSSSFRLK